MSHTTILIVNRLQSGLDSMELSRNMVHSATTIFIQMLNSITKNFNIAKWLNKNLSVYNIMMRTTCVAHTQRVEMYPSPEQYKHLNSIKLLQLNIQYLGGTKSNVNRGVININTV